MRKNSLKVWLRVVFTSRLSGDQYITNIHRPETHFPHLRLRAAGHIYYFSREIPLGEVGRQESNKSFFLATLYFQRRLFRFFVYFRFISEYESSLRWLINLHLYEYRVSNKCQYQMSANISCKYQISDPSSYHRFTR